MMKRSRSSRDRERKDRIKLDLDEIRSLLPKRATDKKVVTKMVTICCLLTLRTLLAVLEHIMKV